MDTFHLISIVSDFHVTFTGSSIAALVSVAFLLLFSAFLSGSETAVNILGKEEKAGNNEDEDDFPDRRIYGIIEHPDRLTASLSVWNSIVNIVIVVLSVYIIRALFGFSVAAVWLFLLEILFPVVLILVAGEMIPRAYAQKDPLRYITRLVPALLFFKNTMGPFSYLMVKSAQAAGENKKKNNDVSVDELSKALELTSDELSDEKQMLEGIIGLYNKTAVEIMTSRLEIAAIRSSAGFKEVIDYIIEVSYSRIPIYGENQDDIKGILYIKDLLPYLNQPDSFHWQKLIRPAFFVPETKKIDDLLEEFRVNKIHIAVVVDEFGGTSGVVTMEDILEEIVGDISDEYDEDEDQKCIRNEDGSYTCDAKILLTDFFRSTGIDPKAFGKLTDEIDTLGGLVLEIKEDFPQSGEIVYFNNYAFKVLEMDDRRILKIQYYQNDPDHPKE